jgi:hypothetical protein
MDTREWGGSQGESDFCCNYSAIQGPHPVIARACARLRGVMGTIEATANLDKKCLTKTRQSCFIEPRSGCKLGLGKRMNLELAHGRLRRTRARASSAETGATRPS